MRATQTDEKGRVLLSKEIRKLIGIKPRDQLVVKPFGKSKLILEKVPTRKQSIKIPIFGKPLHVSLKKIKKTNLEKIEEKMWSD